MISKKFKEKGNQQQTDSTQISISNGINKSSDSREQTNRRPEVTNSEGMGAGAKRKVKTKPTFSELITKVETVQDARRVLKIIEQIVDRNEDHIWACDTEVADIDLKVEGPVGNGRVICASICGGPHVDFGDGPGTTVWVDNLDAAEGVLQEFKDFFENPRYKKVWHNYGFDRHVMHNEGIDCQGFVGDTFHMARLWDSSREKAFGSGEGYSLESLSNSVIDDDRFKKVSMKELFGTGKVRKDGTESVVKQLPPLREVQRNPELRQKWIEYSARDAVATWWLRFELENELVAKEWRVDGKKLGTLYDFYMEYMVDFGELLTDMERNGIKLDTEVHLKEAERRAREERVKMEEIFLSWAEEYCKDARWINTASSTQIQQLLFGKYEKEKLVEPVRVFEIDKEEEEYADEVKSLAAINPYAMLTSPELKNLLRERGMKLTGKKGDLVQRLLDFDTGVSHYALMELSSLHDICAVRGLAVEGTKEMLVQQLVDDDAYKKSMSSSLEEAKEAKAPEKLKKYREITIKTIGLKPLDYTPAGSAQVSATILKKLAGQNLFGEEKDMVFGQAYSFFGGGEGGKRGCQAIGALANIGQIDATITNFLVPLQALVDKNNRIHCSLNLNTETGRLSSRRPNLQNQPALEKDQYKIRDAFVAEPGNTLIVADYGQLELRILAHITNCKSMRDAFTQGGCFHSRTAVGMYPYIKEAVEGGKVLLEWDYSKGQPTVPLVKDTFASERRKAKTLNFSIAYGKTVHGLAQDWGISTADAEETLAAWYRDRPEVKQWQDMTREFCKKEGYVRTLMGRTRELPDARRRGPGQGHALRAAINTPIQGSAADIVMMAMRALWKNETLKRLGWRLLLQIHDEVILEGPRETKDAALAEVRSVMENPYDGWGLSPLSVHLDVDAKSADTWYKAK